jgi:hypothetical protein
MRQLSFTASVLVSALRRAVNSVATFLGPSWDGNIARKTTICMVPDRNGGKSTFRIVPHPLAAPEPAQRTPAQGVLRNKDV